MKLLELIKPLDILQLMGATDLEITGLSQDSRRVEPGYLFFCQRGSKTDSHHHLRDAVAAGAIAAVVEYIPANVPAGVTLIQVQQAATAIEKLADQFYGYPDRRLKLIGVVGTNGKTTSTFLLKSILEAAGYKVGLIGTIANLIGEETVATHNTTPGRLELQQLFAKMVQAGVEYVVMEVSSHGIHQGRVAGFKFESGVFTNITQDHLDYHGSFEEYLKVKTSFFSALPKTSTAAINMDDSHGQYVASRTSAKTFTYGIQQSAMIKAADIELTPDGASYIVRTPCGDSQLRLNLTGYFNVYNSLGVLTTALSLGISLADIKKGLEKITGVPGRFQRVTVPNADFNVIVDYAHTPDGLENILTTARGLNPKRLIVVFGCGGDRDRSKRPLMGKLAARLGDISIITSDNPRSEDPDQIIREIETGFAEVTPRGSYQLQTDRAEAIRSAIRLAQSGDLVLIAGKGHETYQIFADRTIHFDDREIAKAALEERFHA